MRLGPVAQSSGMAGQGGSRVQRDWMKVSPRLTAPRDGRQSRQSCRRLQRGWAGRDGAGDRRAFPRGVAIAGSRWASRVAPSDQGTCRTVVCRARLGCTCCTPMPSTSSNAPTRGNPLLQRVFQGGWCVSSKNAEVVAPLIGVQLVSSWGGNLWGGPSGSFGSVEGLRTPSSPAMVA